MLSFPDFAKKRILVVFSTEGQRISIQNDNILIKNKEEKTVLQDTCYRILAVWIIGNCSITSVVLQKSKKYGFPVYHLSSSFRPVGIWNAPTEGNFLLRHKQYYCTQETAIAKRLVTNKINNQISLLKEIRKKEFAEQEAIKQMEAYLLDLEKTMDEKIILGLEGISSKVFFPIYFKQTGWQGRQPRTKLNPLNTLMDIGYTFLFYWIENMLGLYGFDIYKGVYHKNFYQRKSLVCDLVEPFRCIIDKALRKACNLGQMHTEDFVLYKNQYTISYDKTKHYTNLFMTAIAEYKNDIFYYCQSYYRAFVQEKPADQFPCFDILNPIK